MSNNTYNAIGFNESDEMFKSSVESMLDCFAIFTALRDEYGKIIDFILEYANDAACAYKRVVREEMVGKRLLDVLPYQTECSLFDEYCKVIEAGEPMIKQCLSYEGCSGYERLSKAVDVRAVKMKDGFVMTWRDITERIRVEKALQESEEKFRGAFENASIGMAITGFDGRWLKVNRSLCEMMGYSENELLQLTFQEMTYPDDLELNLDYFQQAIKGEIGYYHMEKRFIHKQGHVIWTVLSASLVRDSKSEPLYFTTQIQDITRIKQANEALEFDKLKTDFFANLSHELRTPASIILSTLQLVEYYSNHNILQSDIINKYTDVMKQNCYRLVKLINNLIDATKIDAGFYELSLQNCNIVSVVENITLSVAEYINSKGIQLLFDTNVEEKVMACDPDKMERIILNLLSNAVKFTKRDGKIKVSIHEENENITIKVKDNGIGIKKENFKIIFERFRQVDKSLARNSEGSGIGLSLVKSLVEMHGGTIQVKSKYGLGSEFIIKLPCKTLDINNNNSAYEQNSNNIEDYIERINIELSDIYFENPK